MGQVRARLASQNPHKLAELRAALPGWELDALPLDAYPEETGATYEENARGKALHGLRVAPAGAWVIGEDSGLEVVALAGRPGLHTARYAPAGAPAIARLLEELASRTDRRARYVCALVAVAGDGEERTAVGILEGAIGERPSGCEGFGFDPVFVPDGEARTVAELGDDWKREHSHRARAAAALRAALGP
jgi:XTP/dITP diphosphohydrolase